MRHARVGHHLHHAGMPCGVEFLDLLAHHYLADAIAWGAVGARTTESQVRCVLCGEARDITRITYAVH
jgi:phospho-2-dehydro-3-deoxyheptonate aldolase